MHILETRDLVHSFSNDEVVLKGISLCVEEGSIYGFLGPNGAGKTTTLRLVLGLLARQEGSISVFGKDFAKHRVESLRRIGSLIESPSIYSHLTAEENLRVLQKVYRCPRSRIGEVLELVGLANTGKKKAGEFSLGMKQRLSIAIALLNSPSLLILDEPTNGLDPQGTREVRHLVASLAEDGATVLISSHLLSEVEQICTHLGIMSDGRLVAQGTVHELRGAGVTTVGVTTSRPSDAASVLGRLGVTDVEVVGDEVRGHPGPVAPEAIVAALVHADVPVRGFAVTTPSLEDLFVSLTGEGFDVSG